MLGADLKYSYIGQEMSFFYSKRDIIYIALGLDFQINSP